MTRLGTGVRVALGLAAVLGGFLVVTGLMRLTDDAGGTAAPAARLVVGALLVAGTIVVALVGSRRAPRDVTTTADRAGPHAETMTCPACGEANPPSARHCTACDEPLR